MLFRSLGVSFFIVAAWAAQAAMTFFGTGSEAGRAAGRLRDPGRMLVLMPIQRAYAMLMEIEP